MSLLDTIKGARAEAADAASQRTIAKKDEAAEAEGEAATGAGAGAAQKQQSSQGFSRRSTARAKPARKAAGSVSTKAKPKSEMTKEERKAERAKRRDDEDLAYDVKKTLLESDEAYRKTQRVWWVLLICGIALTLMSWGVMRYMQQNSLQNQNLAIVSIACMVVAYALVIGAFIYDIIKVRPMRKRADEKVSGMTKRRMQRVLDEEEARRQEARKAKK